MKTKLFLSTLLVTCCMLVCTTIQASAQAPAAKTLPNDSKELNMVAPPVDVRLYGLSWGTVYVNVTNGEKEYSFSGTSNGVIGTFLMEGDSFLVTVSPYSVSPAFARIASSANLWVETPYSMTSKVSTQDDIGGGEVVILFGNY